MKFKMTCGALFLAVLSTLFFTVRGFTQPDKQTALKGDTVVIDISKIGKKMNAPEDTLADPGGGGKIFQLQRWNKEHLNKAIEELKYCFKNPEKTYLLTEVPAPWITLALIQALQPLKVHYLYPAPGGTDLELMHLKRGKAAENYGALFEVKEEGDNVYINLTTDKPSATPTGAHTFNLENLPKVVIPKIPAGKNVFIHGKGMYGAMVIIAWNYAKDAKTLSMAAHETDYVCAVSHSKTLEPGDVTKRTWENNL
jgi:hypothetical protein